MRYTIDEIVASQINYSYAGQSPTDGNPPGRASEFYVFPNGTTFDLSADWPDSREWVRFNVVADGLGRAWQRGDDNPEIDWPGRGVITIDSWGDQMAAWFPHAAGVRPYSAAGIRAMTRDAGLQFVGGVQRLEPAHANTHEIVAAPSGGTTVGASSPVAPSPQLQTAVAPSPTLPTTSAGVTPGAQASAHASAHASAAVPPPTTPSGAPLVPPQTTKSAPVDIGKPVKLSDPTKAAKSAAGPSSGIEGIALALGLFVVLTELTKRGGAS